MRAERGGRRARRNGRDQRLRLAAVFATGESRQAARISDHAAFVLLGRLEEVGESGKISEAPKTKRTEDYITGELG